MLFLSDFSIPVEENSSMLIQDCMGVMTSMALPKKHMAQHLAGHTVIWYSGWEIVKVVEGVNVTPLSFAVSWGSQYIFPIRARPVLMVYPQNPMELLSFQRAVGENTILTEHHAFDAVAGNNSDFFVQLLILQPLNTSPWSLWLIVPV